VARGNQIDLATVLGLASAFGLLALAVALGGATAAFVNWPAILIVLGGTFAITMICFSLPEVLRAQTVLVKAVFRRRRDTRDAAREVMALAARARKDGVLSLQRLLIEFEHEPFLRRALELVVDGTPGDEVERILRSDVNAMRNRHLNSASVLRKAAEIAPAMGLIGTLVGLVQMLSNLDNPASIGPAMAVALLTTFYGAILANMVFTPLASKLERNSTEEALLHNVYAMAAAAISRQENPRRLELLLNTLLPPTQQLDFYE